MLILLDTNVHSDWAADELAPELAAKRPERLCCRVDPRRDLARMVDDVLAEQQRG